MVDLEHFDANPDPDPTFQADADPDPNPFPRVINFFLQIFISCFQSLPKLVMCNYSARMREEGVNDEGQGMRGEGGGVREER